MTGRTFLDERLGFAAHWVFLPSDVQGSIIATLDFMRLLEALVLHARPVLRFHARLREDLWLGNPVLAPFVEAGILEIERYESEQVSASMDAAKVANSSGLLTNLNTARLALAHNREHLINAIRHDGAYVGPVCGFWGATIAATRYVAGAFENIELEEGDEDLIAEEEHFIALASQAMNAEQANPSTLLRGYERIKDESTRLVELAREHGRPIPIAIPPIASIVLDGAATREGIGNMALDLRYQLQPHRERFAEFEERMLNEDLSVQEVLGTIRDFQRAMHDLIEGPHDFVGVADVLEASSTAINYPAGPWAASLSTARLLAGKAQELTRWRRKRQVIFLSILRDRAMKVTGYGKLLLRHFGRTFTQHEVDETLTAIKSLDETALNADADSLLLDEDREEEEGE